MMAGLLWYRSYMDSLANTSGYYPDIHAGHADRTSELTLTVPYLSRSVPSGYTQLELAQIIGGTMVIEGSLQSVEATAHVTKDANDSIIATYPLANITLRGITETVDGILYYNGDTYDPDGTVTRKWGEVDLGTLTWTKDTLDRFWATLSDMKQITATDQTQEGLVCARFIPSKTVIIDRSVDNAIARFTDRIYVIASAYSTAADFKTAMNGVGLVYELATSTTETADPYTAVQDIAEGGSEEVVTGNNVPVGNVSVYRRA